MALLARTKTLQKNNIALVGPLTGADSLRKPFGEEEHKAEQGNYQLSADTMTEGHIPQLFHVRAGYGDEARKIVKQAVSRGCRKSACSTPDDAFGKTGLVAINGALKEHKLQLASKGIYSAKTGDVTDAVKTFPPPIRKQSSCWPTPPGRQFHQAVPAMDPGAQLFALSTVSARSLVKGRSASGHGSRSWHLTGSADADQLTLLAIERTPESHGGICAQDPDQLPDHGRPHRRQDHRRSRPPWQRWPCQE